MVWTPLTYFVSIVYLGAWTLVCWYLNQMGIWFTVIIVAIILASIITILTLLRGKLVG